MSTVVFTACFGNYVPLNPPPPLGMPCIAFTDGPQNVYGWETRLTEPHGNTPRLQAKWPKMHAHELFPEHEIAIWIDAGCRIASPDFVTVIVEALGDAPMVFFPHRWRSSIYPEALETLALPKYNGLPVVAQVMAYRSEGFPDSLGLAECTCFATRPHDPRTLEFMAAWWDEQIKWSPCDQLSWPYAAWKTGQTPKFMPYDFAHQNLFDWVTWRADA